MNHELFFRGLTPLLISVIFLFSFILSSLKIVSLRKQKTMLRILIFLFLSAFSVVLSAQNIDDVDVSRKPDGE